MHIFAKEKQAEEMLLILHMPIMQVEWKKKVKLSNVWEVKSNIS
jgi:hypothetical protein